MSEYRFDLSCKDHGTLRKNIGHHILSRVALDHAKKHDCHEFIVYTYELGPRIKSGATLPEEPDIEAISCSPHIRL